MLLCDLLTVNAALLGAVPSKASIISNAFTSSSSEEEEELRRGTSPAIAAVLGVGVGVGVGVGAIVGLLGDAAVVSGFNCATSLVASLNCSGCCARNSNSASLMHRAYGIQRGHISTSTKLRKVALVSVAHAEDNELG